MTEKYFDTLNTLKRIVYMDKNIRNFVNELAALEAMPRVCNQYANELPENEIRRSNLFIYLNKMNELRPKIMLVGEAPGYRGCRLTGVPFTSEHLLMNGVPGLDLFGEKQGFRLASKDGRLLKEATATIIWETLMSNDMIALGWNSFPFHPHREGMPESNRAPLTKELKVGEKPLLMLLELFDIKTVVAVGNKAEETLNNLNIPCHKVRHPAQGGKNQFVEGIRKIREGML